MKLQTFIQNFKKNKTKNTDDINIETGQSLENQSDKKDTMFKFFKTGGFVTPRN